MDPELKAKWIADLRGGEIKQARGRLLDDQGGMCCVGVLARICGVSDATMRSRPKHLYSEDLSPVGVAVENNTAALRKLAGMNDDGKTFDEIADYIEANL